MLVVVGYESFHRVQFLKITTIVNYPHCSKQLVADYSLRFLP